MSKGKTKLKPHEKLIQLHDKGKHVIYLLAMDFSALLGKAMSIMLSLELINSSCIVLILW